MPGLVPGIHVLVMYLQEKAWMAGTSPAMTVEAALVSPFLGGEGRKRASQSFFATFPSFSTSNTEAVSLSPRPMAIAWV